MRRRLNGQSGMSLVEATIILAVLAILTSVLAPSIADYVNDAKATKAKEDCEAIGTAIWRAFRDVQVTNFPNLLSRGTDIGFVTSGTNMEDVLVTNSVPYTTASSYGNGPNTVVGWRGAYLSAPIGPDPWGDAYEANSANLNGTNYTNQDTICISAGPNQGVDTTVGGSGSNYGTTLSGDDIVYVIAGENM